MTISAENSNHLPGCFQSLVCVTGCPVETDAFDAWRADRGMAPTVLIDGDEVVCTCNEYVSHPIWCNASVYAPGEATR